MRTGLSDRPLKRRAIKLAYSIFAGRDRAHWQETAFGLRIDRAHGKIMYLGEKVGQLAPACFQDADEIVIVGSGPSLRDQDVSQLPIRSAILLNGAASLAPQVAPLFIAVEDERFIWRHFSMLRDIRRDCGLLLSPGAVRAILEQDREFLKDRRVSLIDNLLKPVHEVRRRETDPSLTSILDTTRLLSLDPEVGVVPAGTVALSAMQFALAAKPAKISLAGIDLKNAFGPRFYETAREMAPSGIVRGMDRILSGFVAAQQVAASRGIALGCLSPVSALLDVGYPFDPRISRSHSQPLPAERRVG
ncbi:glycosyl transferase [Cereibacter sphaeroides]|uniref:glycosyl transferase n=1 Tax=Cereibacter sphaeroides TaxID=1063 RepID=UPI000191CBDE|nr:glycosyl transferase [Cereibacter sphaeroides]ACM03704.1 glycosyltransferase protein [Cereibacter sphaeroides KD131]RHZ91123.1 glycosyl transferase [Cereibacter sphaeroides]